VLSIPAKAVVVRKNKTIRWRSFGRPKASCASAMLGREAFLEKNHGEDQRQRREDRRGESRPGQLCRGRIGAGKQPADCRAKGEAEAEGGADHAHALGAVGLVGHVADIGLCRRDIPGPGPGEEPRRVKHPQRIRHAEPEIRGDRAGKADEEDRLAAEPVGEPAPNRRGEELGEGIARHHRRHFQRRGVEVEGVVRQQRDHDPEADQVNEHDEEEDGHAERRSIARIGAARQRDSGALAKP
jgi:hypothetical protein